MAIGTTAALIALAAGTSAGSYVSSRAQSGAARDISRSQNEAALEAARLEQQQRERELQFQREQAQYQAQVYQQYLADQQRQVLPNLLMQYFARKTGLSLPSASVPPPSGLMIAPFAAPAPTVGPEPRTPTRTGPGVPGVVQTATPRAVTTGLPGGGGSTNALLNMISQPPAPPQPPAAPNQLQSWLQMAQLLSMVGGNPAIPSRSVGGYLAPMPR